MEVEGGAEGSEVVVEVDEEVEVVEVSQAVIFIVVLHLYFCIF